MAKRGRKNELGEDQARIALVLSASEKALLDALISAEKPSISMSQMIRRWIHKEAKHNPTTAQLYRELFGVSEGLVTGKRSSAVQTSIAED